MVGEILPGLFKGVVEYDAPIGVLDLP